MSMFRAGITPFPYKVAKALDPDIYRNIEYDSWSEMRKEQRLRYWYSSGNYFQVNDSHRIFIIQLLFFKPNFHFN